MSQILFELVSNSKNRSSSFQAFTVSHSSWIIAIPYTVPTVLRCLQTLLGFSPTILSTSRMMSSLLEGHADHRTFSLFLYLDWLFSVSPKVVLLISPIFFLKPLLLRRWNRKVLQLQRYNWAAIWDLRFQTMWHFDKCRLRQACAASFQA